ncbi:conserved hypothetical protein [Stigmatella aurantiaca DW4/3-1]|uniref:Uncharacterized protein n=1 Tax=Stigmatella aurantiaca (strain DW4/3-1) TaxID=378806 RepID=Q08Q68_STIAD|nr:conserved hypothetical protein [Stigmatella aurantiaca DW4/3-1]
MLNARGRAAIAGRAHVQDAERGQAGDGQQHEDDEVHEDVEVGDDVQLPHLLFLTRLQLPPREIERHAVLPPLRSGGPGIRVARLTGVAARQQVLQPQRVELHALHHALGVRGEDEVEDDAEHGDGEREGRVVHGLGDAVRQELLLLLRRHVAERLEGADEAEDGAHQPDEGGDVRQRPQPGDAGAHVRGVLDEGLFHGLGHFNLAAVGAGEARADHLGQGGVGRRAAQLHRAVHVARHDELGDLLHEGRGVEVVAEHQREEAFGRHRQGAGKPEQVHEHEGTAVLEELHDGVHDTQLAALGSGRQQHSVQQVAHHEDHRAANPFDARGSGSRVLSRTVDFPAGIGLHFLEGA